MSATRLGLGFAGEYSLISLIAEAPEVLKVATGSLFYWNIGSVRGERMAKQ